MRNVMMLLVLALVLTACGAKPTPTPAGIPVGFTDTPASAPTQPPPSSNTPSPTTAATLTPAVITSPQPTGSASLLEPTLPMTLTPIATISLDSTATPLFVFTLPTVTPPATPFDCSLLTKSVADGTEFDPGERFSVGWQIMNSGSATWYPGTTVLQYFGGTKMYIYPTVPLQVVVQPGVTTSISVDMRAPQNSTTYTTLFTLHQGDNYFCRVRVSIWVKEKP
jgi:hypothetical protein